MSDENLSTVLPTNREPFKLRDARGQLHNENGPAVMRPDGTIEYWIHGELHREDGPAVILEQGESSFYEWWVKDELQRLDGPAVLYSTDGKIYFYEYWMNCVDITKEVNQWREEMGITNIDFTPEESALFVLYFGNTK